MDNITKEFFKHKLATIMDEVLKKNLNITIDEIRILGTGEVFLKGETKEVDKAVSHYVKQEGFSINFLEVIDGVQKVILYNKDIKLA